jgi:hypothetical protein
MIRFIICQPYKLVYRPVPKCASTTLFKLLGELGGCGPSPRPRDALPIVSGRAPSGRGGSYVLRCPEDALADLARRCAEYVWFSVVRDPYARVVSNYHNKLNRYAKRFAPGVYLSSYVCQALHGRAPWKDNSQRNGYMRARIPFDQFVRGLQRRGIGWDPYFRLQTEVLRVDKVRYHYLVKMEHLAAGLGEVFAQAGAGPAGEDVIARLGWLNRSSAAETPDLWTPATRAIVADLYRADFEALGYAI